MVVILGLKSTKRLYYSQQLGSASKSPTEGGGILTDSRLKSCYAQYISAHDRLVIESDSTFGVASLKIGVLSLFLCFSSVAVFAAGSGASEEGIVQHYLTAEHNQNLARKGASMDIDIEASLPRLKKEGRFHALRRISPLGLITYEKRRFDGDKTVRNQVILRYLTAEAEAQRSASPDVALTPDNYKFKYKGQRDFDGRPAHIFEVSPRKKRQGLYQGEVWIDAATYLRVQETGRLVKNPSIFLKRVAFVRKYDIRDGISVPRQVQSVVDTRLVGKAELTIAFSNFSTDDQHSAAADVDNQNW
jgi:hypothetical protein